MKKNVKAKKKPVTTRERKTIRKLKADERAAQPPEHLHEGFMLLHCPIWETRDGRRLRVDRMSSKHLQNAYAHINKRVRMHHDALHRLMNVQSSMNAVLTSRGIHERPGEDPPFPGDITDYPENAFEGYRRRNFTKQLPEDRTPSPILDPMGYLRWAARHQFP
jgi:hypothetical protein